MTIRNKPLTDKQVQAAKPSTNMRDGGGLFLRVSAKGGKSWVFRYASPAGDRTRKGREMGMGSYPDLSLSGARVAATEGRTIVNQGRDPINERDTKRTASAEGASAKAVAPTLGDYAENSYLPDLFATFADAAHRRQWQVTFKTYFAALRNKKLAKVTKKDVLDVLRPLWAVKYDTQSRSRERLERLYDHASQNFAFSGENPAMLRHFNTVLVRPKTIKHGHHASIPHKEFTPFISALPIKQRNGLTALMVELIAFAACRSGDARCAVWSEIDFEKSLWIIPKERTKPRRSHVIPLTP